MRARPEEGAGEPGISPSPEAPGGMRASGARAAWRPLGPQTLRRRIRQAYRGLVEHWGASRQDLRVVRLAGLMWLSPGLALVGAGDVVVLARERPDRRLQVYHANFDQSVTFSAGRLEADPLAAWTHPLRALVYSWLAQGVEVTGMDAVIACACPAHEPVAFSAVAACALACWRPPWHGGGGGPELLRQPPWPEGWRDPVAALIRAAETSEEADRLWVLVGLPTVGPAGAGGPPITAVDRGGLLRAWVGAGLAADPAGPAFPAPSWRSLARAVEQADVEALACLLGEAASDTAFPRVPAGALVADPAGVGGLILTPCGWVGLAGDPDGHPKGLTGPGELQAGRHQPAEADAAGHPVEPAGAAARACIVRRR